LAVTRNDAERQDDYMVVRSLQLRYSLLDRTPERELLPMAQAFDLPVFFWGPLAGGRLTGNICAGAGPARRGPVLYQRTWQ
jgi:aryl-alcohol dehydrogenase-like predicted oxidoreductase